MSYLQMDIEEIPTDTMTAEILRRTEYLTMDRCPYCKQSIPGHTCKYRGRLSKLIGPAASYMFAALLMVDDRIT